MIKKNIRILIIIFILIIITAIFLPKITLMGKIINEEGIEYSKTLNLQFSYPTEYKIKILEKGQLISLKITGSFKESGTGKISFQNKTIVEIKNNSANENIINFELEGLETSDLTKLNYSNQSYLLKIEVKEGTFMINKLYYKIIPFETPKEKLNNSSIEPKENLEKIKINKSETKKIIEKTKKSKIKENQTMKIIKRSIIGIIILFTIIVLIKQKNPKKKKQTYNKKRKK
jgi:hypothetical protein